MRVYPTLEEIRRLSGENIITLAGTEERAKAEVKQYVDFFYRTLNKENTQKTYNQMVELIKTNDDWRNEFINLIASLFYEEYNSEKPKEEIVVELIEGSHLFRNKRLWLL